MFQVVALLWVVSTITSWFNFLTCIWIGELSLPGLHLILSVFIASLPMSFMRPKNCFLFADAGIVLLHVVPLVYDMYEDVIDHHAKQAVEAANVHYKKLDDAVLRKIPRAPARRRKSSRLDDSRAVQRGWRNCTYGCIFAACDVYLHLRAYPSLKTSASFWPSINIGVRRSRAQGALKFLMHLLLFFFSFTSSNLFLKLFQISPRFRNWRLF